MKLRKNLASQIGFMAKKKYDDLSKDELVRLLEARDRRDATRFGLVWEANEIERDKALNNDFVALDLDKSLSCPSPSSGTQGEGRGDGTPHAPREEVITRSVMSTPVFWRNLIIEGDNFDALRYLRMTFAGRVKCIYIDPPYNT